MTQVPLNADAVGRVRFYSPTTGLPVTPSPAATVQVVRHNQDLTRTILVAALTAATQEVGDTTVASYLLDDSLNTALGELEYIFTTTDAALTPYGEGYSVRRDSVQVEAAAAAGTVDANVVSWLSVAPLALTSQKVNAQVAGIDADVITSTAVAASAVTEIAAGVLDVAASAHNGAGTIGALINLITAAAGSAAAFWNYLTSATNVVGSMKEYILARLGMIGAGAVFVQSTTDGEGNVILYRGKTQTLRWTSESTLDLSVAAAVRFQFNLISVNCTVTGSSGDWEIEVAYPCPMTVAPGFYVGELAYYTSTTEHEALLSMDVTVRRNPGLEGQ